MRHFFADLHIHVGVSSTGQWIKIPTSRQLTVENILDHSANQKGLEIVGIVDALSPQVLNDLEKLCAVGLLQLESGGGYRYNNKITLLLGAEIETSECGGGMSHSLIFLPDIASMRELSKRMSSHITNINLSSQNARMPLAKLISIAAEHEAIIIPAHIFTPYKSIYGACANRLSRLLPDKELNYISAVELGLSADSDMADRIGELGSYTFVTNSDAHSLDKIGREYNIIAMELPTYNEFVLALARKAGRRIIANYGLNPRLGKYHRTLCEACSFIDQQGEISHTDRCPRCSSKRIICGVLDRINAIADTSDPVHPAHRASYYYQVPLEFIPGLGKKSMEKLLHKFGTEMTVLHEASELELVQTIGEKVASALIAARTGAAVIEVGGGGTYGKMKRTK